MPKTPWSLRSVPRGHDGHPGQPLESKRTGNRPMRTAAILPIKSFAARSSGSRRPSAAGLARPRPGDVLGRPQRAQEGRRARDDRRGHRRPGGGCRLARRRVTVVHDSLRGRPVRGGGRRHQARDRAGLRARAARAGRHAADRPARDRGPARPRRGRRDAGGDRARPPRHRHQRADDHAARGVQAELRAGQPRTAMSARPQEAGLLHSVEEVPSLRSTWTRPTTSLRWPCSPRASRLRPADPRRAAPARPLRERRFGRRAAAELASSRPSSWPLIAPLSPACRRCGPGDDLAALVAAACPPDLA